MKRLLFISTSAASLLAVTMITANAQTVTTRPVETKPSPSTVVATPSTAPAARPSTSTRPIQHVRSVVAKPAASSPDVLARPARKNVYVAPTRSTAEPLVVRPVTEKAK